ncbi:hypothetical protein M427DRAFT_34856 [Gonapodya prolifera JEL478]|uniref:Uncharacterized protein n=1 Tax=Gonapodya prolifera (strain JEL478) TaxID=1344416 RepID=A0A139A653_GONPJ|nr:hypothetical protein M427DRAFT_34856 [Gonapodya prolifera JEL478]|eukprot:KXS12300.1 hypothetical protein M427DRAFT_34856 [Gonapodya prolifera JEL478]
MPKGIRSPLEEKLLLSTPWQGAPPETFQTLSKCDEPHPFLIIARDIVEITARQDPHCTLATVVSELTPGAPLPAPAVTPVGKPIIITPNIAFLHFGTVNDITQALSSPLTKMAREEVRCRYSPDEVEVHAREVERKFQ